MNRTAIGSGILRWLYIISIAFTLIMQLSSSVEAQREQYSKTGKETVIRGLIVEDGSLKPVKNIRLGLCEASTDPSGKTQYLISPNMPSCTTDAKGHFEIRGIEPGNYGLFVNGNYLLKHSGDSSRFINVKVNKYGELVNLGKIMMVQM